MVGYHQPDYPIVTNLDEIPEPTGDDETTYIMTAPDEYIFYLGFQNNIPNKNQLVEQLGQSCQRLLLVEGETFRYVA